MEEIVYLNGRLLPASQAWLSPFDHGFLYGLGLFETMRAYSGKVFRLKQHLTRLRSSAGLIALADKIAEYNLAGAVQDTIQANALKDARIRLTVSAGPGEIVPDPYSCGEPTVFIVARPYTPLSNQVYERGFKACVSTLRRDSTSPISRMKSCNYLPNILARQEAKLSGFDEALLLNEKGQLTEGSASNIFLVCDGLVLTPPAEGGILPGITREVVLEIAPSLGIEVIERMLVPEDLFRAQEAFLTNSIIEIMPLTAVDNRLIGSGSAGTLTGKLISAYRNVISSEIEAK